MRYDDMTDAEKRAAAWNIIRRDLVRLVADPHPGCRGCSPADPCSYAIGVTEAYRKVEQRFEPRPLDFPPQSHFTGVAPEPPTLPPEGMPL